MIDSQPVSFLQALRLMGWLAIRRQINRWQSVRFGRKTSDPTKRTGTASKSTGRGVYSFFLFAILLFNGFNLASQGLGRLAAFANNVHIAADKIAVSSYTRQKLVDAEASIKSVKQIADPDERQKYEGLWDRYLDQILQGEVSREGLPEDEESAKVQRMHAAFDQNGATAFSVEFGSQLYAGGDTWPRTDGPATTYQNTLGLLALVFVPMFVCLWLGMNNKDLGQVEWSFEWLYGFPISTRALLASRLFVYSLFNPPVWMFIFPFLIMVYFTGGCGFASIPLGLGATLYLSVLAGSVTMLLEVFLRKFLNLSQLKNLQALFTVMGTVCLLLYLASLFSQPLEGFLVAHAKELPAAFAWNPLSFYLLLGSPTGTPAEAMRVSALMAIIAVGISAGALFSAEFLIREGLIKSSGPYQGVRRQPQPQAAASAGWLRGVSANEMILLRRDRNLLVQVLVSPLIVVAYYFLVNSSMVASATGNFHHAATMAFVIGSYVLMSSAMPVLNREKNTLWQLMTFPHEISSILVEKTRVWAVFALFYAGAILLILAYFNHHLHPGALLDAFLALYGVGLYAFIAAGIGIMGTNTLETDVRARFRIEMVYLYMILVAMYAVTIYTPSIWSKFAQMVLSTLLAYALWQKVKDVSPYLLDPSEKPARALSLADGMVAALAFFVLQALFGFFFSQIPSMPLAMQVVLAYVIAGFLVFVLCLSIFTSQKIPHVWQSVGLSRDPANAMPVAKVIVIGLAYGAAAALGAMIYLHAIDLIPQGRIWKQDAEMSALLRRADNPLWLCGLAVIAAPLFEEFIFRGLVFQGLRRSAGPFFAVLASAALFAMVHPPFAVIPVFGLGLATALSFQRTGVLLAPIIAHATYNACVIFLNH
jgi:membrane protease YdiL (CAAX protease family)